MTEVSPKMWVNRECHEKHQKAEVAMKMWANRACEGFTRNIGRLKLPQNIGWLKLLQKMWSNRACEGVSMLRRGEIGGAFAGVYKVFTRASGRSGERRCGFAREGFMRASGGSGERGHINAPKWSKRVCLCPSKDRDPMAQLMHRASQGHHMEAVIEHLCPGMSRGERVCVYAQARVEIQGQS